jgi:hypothetical protein
MCGLLALTTPFPGLDPEDIDSFSVKGYLQGFISGGPEAFLSLGDIRYIFLGILLALFQRSPVRD